MLQHHRITPSSHTQCDICDPLVIIQRPPITHVIITQRSYNIIACEDSHHSQRPAITSHVDRMPTDSIRRRWLAMHQTVSFGLPTVL